MAVISIAFSLAWSAIEQARYWVEDLAYDIKRRFRNDIVPLLIVQAIEFELEF